MHTGKVQLPKPLTPPFPLCPTPAARPPRGRFKKNRRALCEHSELARPPHSLRPPNLMRPDGASMVLGPFAETKGSRLPGRTPAY